MMPLLPVSEIFGPTIQGEGEHIGRRAVFVRLAGCDSRCSWCDTKYAWGTEGATHMSEDEIVDAVSRLGPCRLVVITGGNPAMYDLEELVTLLTLMGKTVHVETQGTIRQGWLRLADLVTISPKADLPMDALSDLVCDLLGCTSVQIKVVIHSRADFDRAVEIGRRLPAVPLILQAGYDPASRAGSVEPATLANWFARDGGDLPPSARLLPQLHRVLWGDARGV